MRYGVMSLVSARNKSTFSNFDIKARFVSTEQGSISPFFICRVWIRDSQYSWTKGLSHTFYQEKYNGWFEDIQHSNRLIE
jgi:hypothetical protein